MSSNRVLPILMIALVFFSAFSCIAAEENVQHRKLMQLQRPWLRIPVYETVNPFRIIGGIGTTLQEEYLSYGPFGDVLGDFFDASFEYASNVFGALGNGL